MSRHDVTHRFQHRLLDTGMLEFQVENQPLDALPLQGEVPTRRAAAANDGQPLLLGVEPRLILANVDERTNHDVLAVVGDEPCRHRLERSREKEIQQERLNEVVQVVVPPAAPVTWNSKLVLGTSPMPTCPLSFTTI